MRVSCNSEREIRFESQIPMPQNESDLTEARVSAAAAAVDIAIANGAVSGGLRVSRSVSSSNN